MSSENQITYTVPDAYVLERADKVLANHFKDFSRNQLQSIFDDKNVLLNGVSINKKHKVSSGDVLTLILPKPKATTVEAQSIPLDIVYEDDDIVIVNKKAGMVVHPGSNTGEDTLVHALLHHTNGKLALGGGELRPGVVHRLDKETSGAIVFAKTDKAYFKLTKMFAEREVHKEYLALVLKVPEIDAGSIKEPIDRHPLHRTKMAVSPNGREAYTDWIVEERFGKLCCLFRCTLHTGRTHQIRVHLSYIKHPIIGDYTYGFNPHGHELLIKAPRVLLHAHKLSFKHPVSGKLIEIKLDLPEDFVEFIRSLKSI